MGVTGQTPATATAGLVVELEANGEEEGEDTLDKRLGVVQEPKVGRLIVEIDGEGAVCTGRFGCLCHVSSPYRWPLMRMRHRGGNVLKDQVYCERIATSPLNSVECGRFNYGDSQLWSGREVQSLFGSTIVHALS